MIKETIRGIVREGVLNAIRAGQMDLSDVESLDIEITRTKDPRFGDYATNAALALAGRSGRKPRELAEIIREHLPAAPEVLSEIQIAGPGFINFFVAPKVWCEVLHTIHREKDAYGSSARPGSPKILLEFVSANPTGPLHVGHGRGAAVGDTLARLLRTCGYSLDTEYYVNDCGNQMKTLGLSLLLRYRQALGEEIEFPDGLYKGQYMVGMAEELKDSYLGAKLLAVPEDEAVQLASRHACDKILEGIKDDLAYFGVHYDRYFHEQELHDTGAVQATLDELRSRGKAEEHEGALWFSMNSEQDEKDRVLVRATGEPTYFAADAAYHENKLRRGYGLLVDVWGSDHHGYVPRVKAAIEALGYSPDNLKVLLVQFVNLIKEGRKISMSTRSGEFETLRNVLDEVGPDAARFFFLTKRCDSHLDFDLDLAKKQSRDNPVYYVQYAHARVSSIFRIATERGIDADMSNPDLTALCLAEELELMKRLGNFPDTLSEAAGTLEPHRITFYLMELADLFHAYYHDNRVLTEEATLKKARLYLVEAVRHVIANGLRILGVSAPDRM